MFFIYNQHHQLSPVWLSSAQSGTSQPKPERQLCLSVMSSDRRTLMWTGLQMGNWFNQRYSTVRCTLMGESAGCCSTLYMRMTAELTCASLAQLKVRFKAACNSTKLSWMYCLSHISAATSKTKLLLFRGSDFMWQTESYPFIWASLHPQAWRSRSNRGPQCSIWL